MLSFREDSQNIFQQLWGLFCDNWCQYSVDQALAILSALNGSTENIDSNRLAQYRIDTFKLYTELYPWYYILLELWNASAPTEIRFVLKYIIISELITSYIIANWLNENIINFFSHLILRFSLNYFCEDHGWTARPSRLGLWRRPQYLIATWGWRTSHNKSIANWF